MINVKEQIRKILKSKYPGCRTYIKEEKCPDVEIYHIRVIHDSFKDIIFSKRIKEVVDLLSSTNSITIVAPITKEEWAVSRW